MNKKAILLLLLFVTKPLTAMDINQQKILQNVIFVISGQWENSADFAPAGNDSSEGGIFYTELEKEVLSKNTKNQQIHTTVIPFVCKEEYRDVITSQKIKDAAFLAEKILQQHRDGASHISIFAHRDGIDVAALATQLLNSHRTELAYRPIDLPITRSIQNPQERLRILQETMQTQRNHLYQIHRAFAAGKYESFSLLDPVKQKKPITVIIINPNPDSPYVKFFEQDSDIVDVVNHVTSKNTGSDEVLTENGEQFHLINTNPSRLQQCCACFRRTLADPRTQKLIAVCLKIAITAAIAAI